MSSGADELDVKCCCKSHRLPAMGKSPFSHCKRKITPTHRMINDDLNKITLMCLAQRLAYIKSLILIDYRGSHAGENVQ